jgi:hypothetical protein
MELGVNLDYSLIAGLGQQLIGTVIGFLEALVIGELKTTQEDRGRI